MKERIRLLWRYRELLFVLAWKEISIRYKQASLGVLWALLKPVILMLIFTVVRSFVGIDSGDTPYPVLTYAALLPWVLFQESVALGVNSVVANAALVRKIYFPREVFPVATVMTKIVELCISFVILAALMLWYDIVPTIHAVWVPFIIAYTLIVALAVCLIGSALNVYRRDVVTFIPIFISLLMYGSPIIYPISLVKQTLLVNQPLGFFSDIVFWIYCTNPITGIIVAFQNAMIMGTSPDFLILLPGMALTAVLLPFSFAYFTKAETYFADII